MEFAPLILKKNEERRLRNGHLWVFSNEVDVERTPLTAFEPGQAVVIQASDGKPLGSEFNYNNYHPLLLGMILERTTGRSPAEYLQEKIWTPLGMEFDGSWSLDAEQNGFEKMESGINARARDYARFGLLFLHNGFWNGIQILPEEWVRESTEPLRPDPRTWETMDYWLDYSGYYKYHWWGINNPDGSYDFYAHGKYDQIIYVAPRKNMVIVRLGNAPDDKLLWPLVLHNIVDQMP